MRYEVHSPEDFGTAIAEFRALRGVTQGQLASRSGINRTYLSRMERGNAPEFITRLVQLLDELGLTITIADS